MRGDYQAAAIGAGIGLTILIYVAIFRLAWNEIIPYMFSVKSFTFVEALSFLVVVSILGSLMFGSLRYSSYK